MVSNGGLLLPEELPAVQLSNTAHLYHRSYRMWGYLPIIYLPPHLTSREKEAVEIINCYQKYQC